MINNKTTMEKPTLKKWAKYNTPFLIVIAAVFVGFIIPLLPIQAPLGHDIYFHMERIESLAESIKAGNWFPRIYVTALNDNGYAAPLFYGDLFLRIPALLVLAGMSLSMAYKSFLMIIAFSATISSYFCFNSIVKNKTAAAVGTVLFSLSSYFATDLFQRAAIGEAQVFVFIPIAFLGYYDIMFKERKKWYLLPVGIFFMLQCHIISTVAFVIILSIFTLFYFDSLINKPSRIIYLLASAVVFFILSAYFIFPMLEQFNSTTFYSTDGTAATKWGTLSKRAMPLWTLFSDFNYSSNFDFDYWIPNGIGLVIFAVWTFYILYHKKMKNSFPLMSLSFGTFILFMISDVFPWSYFQDVFGVMQFPWRLMVFAVFFVSVSAMFIVSNTNKITTSIIIFVLIVLSGFSFLQTVSGKYQYMNEKAAAGDYINYNYNNNVGAYEYLPSGTIASELYTFKEIIRTNNTEMESSYIRNQTNGVFNGETIVTFSNNNKSDTYIELPLVMYKGYTATLTNNEQLEIVYGDNNRVRILLGDLQDGEFVVKYTGTTVQHVSSIVSIIGFILLIIYIILFEMKKKKESHFSQPSNEVLINTGVGVTVKSDEEKSKLKE